MDPKAVPGSDGKGTPLCSNDLTPGVCTEWLSKNPDSSIKPVFWFGAKALCVKQGTVCSIFFFPEMCLAQHSVTFLSKESMWHFICENTRSLHREGSTRAKQTHLLTPRRSSADLCGQNLLECCRSGPVHSSPMLVQLSKSQDADTEAMTMNSGFPPRQGKSFSRQASTCRSGNA